MTYAVDGKQYIAVNVGWNSAIVSNLTNPDGTPFSYAPARLMVFALDAKGVELPPATPSSAIPPPPTVQESPEDVDKGSTLYAANCQTCHGPNAIGGAKDLRHMTKKAHSEYLDIVLGGTRAKLGMPKFDDRLSRAQAEQIHAYLIWRAQEDWQPNFAKAAKQK